MNEFTKRTEKALGSDLVKKFQDNRFCVIGCSGTGANFAEMLVRTGAMKVDLVDGSKVEQSGLNRVFAFSERDCGKKKVKVLKKRLKAIRPEACVRAFPTHFRTPEDSAGNISLDQDVWLSVSNAYVVFIAVDTMEDRLLIEKFCHENGNGRFLSCGVFVDGEKGDFGFQCNWNPDHSRFSQAEDADHDGYGPENASFASIAVEAASAAFTMLLSHLKDQKSSFTEYLKQYNGAFQPVEPEIN